MFHFEYISKIRKKHIPMYPLSIFPFLPENRSLHVIISEPRLRETLYSRIKSPSSISPKRQVHDKPPFQRRLWPIKRPRQLLKAFTTGQNPTTRPLDSRECSTTGSEPFRCILANVFQESFRTPDLNRGPEQAAFQRDAQQFFQQSRSQQQIPHDQFQRAPLPLLATHPPEQDWNQQFQRINISSPPPAQFISSSQKGKQPEFSPVSGWHDEFTRFQSPVPPHEQFSYQPQVQQRLASMAYTTSFPIEQTIPQQQLPSIAPQFEDEAFELAFAEAEAVAQTPAQHDPELMEEEEQPKLSEREEADRLAQTAGELFDRLRHERDTDEKFRNSTFLALMKRLRDREVVVAGNDMVESASLHTSVTETVEEEHVHV